MILYLTVLKAMCAIHFPCLLYDSCVCGSYLPDILAFTAGHLAYYRLPCLSMHVTYQIAIHVRS